MTRENVPFTKLTSKVDLNNVQGLDPLDRGTVLPDLEEPQAVACEKFTVEWGIRKTDNALVLHLYPHIVENNVADAWDEGFQMDKRLDVAIPQFFQKEFVNAGFEATMNSFYIIARNVVSVDLRLLVQRFLKAIEDAPVGPSR